MNFNFITKPLRQLQIFVRHKNISSKKKIKIILSGNPNYKLIPDYTNEFSKYEVFFYRLTIENKDKSFFDCGIRLLVTKEAKKRYND